MSSWPQWLDSSIQKLIQNNRFRTLRAVEPLDSSVEIYFDSDHIHGNASTVKLFSTNDYLGLSSHLAVRNAYARAALRYGSGPRASPLVAGYTVIHKNLESSLASLKGEEECILFPSGFAANSAILASLASDSVDIFSDSLNHASIVDGCRLAARSGSRVLVYRHNDMAHLEELLTKESHPDRRRLVITDSLFSMDGVFANLNEIAALKKKHGFLLALDEAHATLCCGETGAGAAELFGIQDDVDLHIGTLSKAFGCIGGFVACSRSWKNYFVNKTRSQVFSTALPIPVVEAAQAALITAQNECWRRKHLWDLVEHFAGLMTLPGNHTPIIPLILGEESVTMNAHAALYEKGFHVAGIRPPTVPPDSSRLRITLSAAHSVEDVTSLCSALATLGIGAEKQSKL